MYRLSEHTTTYKLVRKNSNLNMVISNVLKIKNTELVSIVAINFTTQSVIASIGNMTRTYNYKTNAKNREMEDES